MRFFRLEKRAHRLAAAGGSRLDVSRVDACRGNSCTRDAGVGNLTLLLATLLLTAFASPLMASEQPVATLLDAAVAHLRERHDPADGELTISPRAPDSRLHLSACAQALHTEFPAARLNGPLASVRVSCSDPGGWSVNILLDLKLERDVLVSARSLARGALLDASDVRAERRDVLRLPYGYVADPARIEDMRLSRSVGAGTALNPGMLAERLLVERGRGVSIVARSGGISIRASGMALEDGVAGDRVRVRNLASGRVVNAVVENTGIVVVSK
jgi:flagellar basal body P-ring formation protein FlgA